MGDSAATLEVLGSNAEDGGRRADELPALLIAWADTEPARVGEVAITRRWSSSSRISTTTLRPTLR
jgi:hypothetical protein